MPDSLYIEDKYANETTAEVTIGDITFTIQIKAELPHPWDEQPRDCWNWTNDDECPWDVDASAVEALLAAQDPPSVWRTEDVHA